MNIYRKKDFGKRYFDIFLPGSKPGETAEDSIRKIHRSIEDSGVLPIAQTDVDLCCGDTVEIDGACYSIGLIGRDYCTVEACGDIEEDPEDREYESELHCPYCGYEIPNTFEFPDTGDERCNRCGSLFSFEREIEITWNSYPLEAAKVKKI